MDDQSESVYEKSITIFKLSFVTTDTPAQNFFRTIMHFIQKALVP